MVQTKLCIVTHTFLPHVGGIEKVVYEQSKRLMKKNYEPMVVTSRIGTPKGYVLDGIQVECYSSLNTGFSLGIPYPIPTFGSFKTFLRSVKSAKIIHAHGHPYLTSLVAGELAKRYGKPFVLTQHNTFIEYDNLFDNVEKVNDLAVGKETLRKADKIVTVSNASRDYVLSLGAKPSKITVLYNGVDLERFRPLPGRQVRDAPKTWDPPRCSCVSDRQAARLQKRHRHTNRYRKHRCKKEPQSCFLGSRQGA